ncbi:DUF3368 domain-containing protein [Caldisalinibacter kiritimatiensis]|uniref:DUF3368 domain-containing protein n=1 Tax=Caldisalinibacter kiritimatiensis TaxID=1304284 RepID=R1CZA7_9FIRM|nr:DUF3368 domain-containing protein [Caldisalinibacter kiritimatiensis]EOD01904.1 hypothetical protein L21TH_0010 [Caldisalinibacter kiritimatiensis]
MTKIVSNSSPIIGLSMIGLLHLLWKMFHPYIPKAVYDEIVNNQSEHCYGKEELKIAVEKGNIKIYEVKDKSLVDKLYGTLHKGEIETVIAAKEMGLTYVLIDEKAARNFATSFFLKPIGILGLLQRAKELGYIEKLKPYLDTLRRNGFRISDKLYYLLLKRVNE